MQIQVLSEQLASQIAAGEVVERPASVVKELLENSLDAQSTRIIIEVEKGGQSLIQISDNGIGIPPDALAVSISSDGLIQAKLPGQSQLSTVGTFQLADFGQVLADFKRSQVLACPAPEATASTSGAGSVSDRVPRR